MKRFICLFLASLLLCLLFGCSKEKIEDPISFYYVRSKYTYGTEDSVIAEELRSISDYSNVSQLINAYLEGPRDIALDCPYPTTTKLIDLRMDGETAYITLSSHTIVLSKAKQTLAGVCLAKTLSGFTDIQTVHIDVAAIPLGSVEPIIITLDEINLYDNLSIQTD